MKTIGLILGIFFLISGGSLFFTMAGKDAGFSLAFLTWGILLVYWAKKKALKQG